MQDGNGALITAQQVQRMFGVDRSTVYRMAEDGRLPALKIGRQWRFPAGRIERLLREGAADGATVDDDSLASPTTQAVIEVAAGLLGVMMVATDMRGEPVTEVCNPCPWYAARLHDARLMEECGREWKLLAEELDLEPRFRPGEHGFECARAFVRVDASLVGMVLVGGVASETAPPGGALPATPVDDGLFHLDAARRRQVLTALPKIAAVLSGALAREQPTSPMPSPLRLARRWEHGDQHIQHGQPRSSLQ